MKNANSNTGVCERKCETGAEYKVDCARARGGASRANVTENKRINNDRECVLSFSVGETICFCFWVAATGFLIGTTGADSCAEGVDGAVVGVGVFVSTELC